MSERDLLNSATKWSTALPTSPPMECQNVTLIGFERLPPEDPFESGLAEESEDEPPPELLSVFPPEPHAVIECQEQNKKYDHDGFFLADRLERPIHDDGILPF